MSKILTDRQTKTIALPALPYMRVVIMHVEVLLANPLEQKGIFDSETNFTQVENCLHL